jgi:signal-transduction protein with cAMP-binding, CBS, and nucleotidyltransferase domain
VAAPINPMIAKLIRRVGFTPLGDEMIEPHSGLPVIPMLLNISDLNDFFYSFAQKNKLYNFLDSYDCLFYEQGEYVVRAGEVGNAAYVIIEGEAEVYSQSSQEVMAVLSQGEIFGELALLTEDTRSADVVAKDNLKIMSLNKSVFIDHLLKHPDKSMDILKSIGSRMRKMLV